MVNAFYWTGRKRHTPFLNVCFPAWFLRWVWLQKWAFGLPLFRVYCGPDCLRDRVTPRWEVCFWMRPGKEIEEGDVIWRFCWSWNAPGRVITCEQADDGVT